jgi:biotin carboxyl carrier protein
VIKFNTIILTSLIFIIVSCSSLGSLNQSYKNFLSSSYDNIYTVQPGDSIWSISIKQNLDVNLLIENNNLEKPFVIYPNQKLILIKEKSNNNYEENSKITEWHYPLGKKSKNIINDEAWLIFKEPKGTPIHSIYSGKIVVSGPDIPGYGNLVMISHSNGFLSLYAHCDRIFVNIGDEVKKGEVIAQIGNSEAAYPMLRFQLRRNGKPMMTDKLDFLF